MNWWWRLLKKRHSLRHNSDFAVFARYAAVGLAQNGFFYGFTLVCLQLGFHAWQAVLVLYPVAVVVSYVANRSWSFGNRNSSPKQFRKYVLVYVIAYPSTVAFTWLGEAAGLPPWLASLTTLVVAAVVMFLAMKFFVFRAHRSGDPTSSG